MKSYSQLIVLVVAGGVAFLTAGANRALADIPQNTGEPMVRVAYMVPCDRVEKEYAVANLQFGISACHSWYADEMEKWGYGRKSFRYETEADGVTPKIHVVHLTQDESYFAVPGSYPQTASAAVSNGVPVYHDGELWLLVPETHQQQEDNSFIGVAYVGGGMTLYIGELSAWGYAFIGSEYLKFLTPEYLCNDESCYGVVDPDVGPYPLGIQWPSATIYRDMAAPTLGGMAHEMGHAFGLPHDNRASGSDYPNLMSWGNYVMHGNLYPDRYSTAARMSIANACVLNLSPYFTTDIPAPHTTSWAVETDDGQQGGIRSLSDVGLADLSSMQQRFDPNDIVPGLPINPDITTAYTPPSVNVTTSGQQSLVDGKLRIQFTASDPDGLVCATLCTPFFDQTDFIPLSGTLFNGYFETAFFGGDPNGTGGGGNYRIAVFDVNGNGRVIDRSIEAVYSSFENRAPRAEIGVRFVKDLNNLVTFRGNETEDPDDAANQLRYEWDLDGDGVFEVNNFGITSASTSYSTPGVKYARLRVTDPHGVSDITPWLTVWVRSTVVGDTNCDGVVDVFDIDPFVEVLVNPDSYGLDYASCNSELADINDDGVVDVFDIDPFVQVLVGG